MRSGRHGFRIGKYEVTNAQYAEFLNAKAASRPARPLQPEHGLGRLRRHHAQREPGQLHLQREAGRENKPVVYVSLLRRAALRELAAQRPGERRHGDGRLHAARAGRPRRATAISRATPGATVFLPSENEWYKAAYYDPASRATSTTRPGPRRRSSCVAPDRDGQLGELRRRRRTACYTDVGATPARRARTARSTRAETCGSGTRRTSSATSEPAASAAAISTTSRSTWARRARATSIRISSTPFLGFRVAVAPEPGRGPLLAAGALLLALLSRRR